jgi:hypothetical protein
MAHQTGSAASFAALQSTIETFLAANGWTLASGVLSKGVQFCKLTASTYELRLDAGTGQAGAALTGPCTQAVKMMDFTLAPISWPVVYEVHALTGPDEVYITILYNVNKQQHLHVGVSNIPQIAGTGMWFGGSFNATVLRTSLSCKVYLQNGNGQGGYVGATPYDGFGLGYFFAAPTGGIQSSFIHCGLEGVGWKTSYGGVTGNLLGPDYTAALLYALPSDSSESDVLLPIHVLLAREAQGQTIIASLAHARYCRLDNLVAGQVITFGPDAWKVYPMHSRNDQQRDGVAWGTGAQHSGTFGVAIRYTGL